MKTNILVDFQIYISVPLTSNRYKIATNKIRPYKYPRFGKYVLHKVQGCSRQRHCLIFNVKESKIAEFFI